ncbi:MAG: DUF1572 domain-containing protein [Terrimonas sp.]|nr:DUF1572 domain-containing protein [Terrimonas sp.]
MINGKEYLETVIKRVRYYKDLADRTFSQLEEKDFYFQPGAASNSIAVIIRHMAGNMLSRWTHFLEEDGEKAWRRRDDEFTIHQHTKKELLDYWEKGWSCFLDALQSLSEKDLSKTVTIRQEPLSVVDAINRQLAHYPYHIGQIVFLGRMIKDEKWQNLSIPKGESVQFNQSAGPKDPANG